VTFGPYTVAASLILMTYAGMSAQDIQNRILTMHERQLASLVDDISRIEAVSYQGVGVEKVYLHEGTDVSRAVVLKYMPPNITPPLVIRYRRALTDPVSAPDPKALQSP
jgi:multidrug efflux pump subunit AcrB